MADARPFNWEYRPPEVPREVFKAALADAIDRKALFYRELGNDDPCTIVQANTRMS